MNNRDSMYYENLYVLQTITNKEFEIKFKINKIFNNQFNMLIPLKELLHTKSGVLVKKIYPLFPGYIFLYMVLCHYRKVFFIMVIMLKYYMDHLKTLKEL
ncbi:MAG: transcription termination/antitermination NusG family protein [bacterium]